MLNVPTELLRTFVSVVELGSFTRAGDAVGRTQSAISLQIRRLEELLEGYRRYLVAERSLIESIKTCVIIMI